MKLSRQVFTSLNAKRPIQLQQRSRQVANWTRNGAECTKMKNSRAKRSKLVFFKLLLLLNIQICEVSLAATNLPINVRPASTLLGFQCHYFCWRYLGGRFFESTSIPMTILFCPCIRLFSELAQWQVLLACSATAVNLMRPSIFSVIRCSGREQCPFQDWTSLKNGPQTGWNHPNLFIISRLLSP